MVADSASIGLHGSESVGAGARLRHAECTHDLTATKARQVAFTLRRRPIPAEIVGDEMVCVQATEGEGGIGVSHGLTDETCRQVIEPLPAPLRRHRRTQISHLPDLAEGFGRPPVFVIHSLL